MTLRVFGRMFGVVALSLVLFAAALNARAEIKADFSGYVRSGLLVGKDFGSGADLHVGSAPLQNRLQELQFLELTLSSHLSPVSQLIFTMGSDGNTTHYTDQWWKDGFSVRNLYFEVTKLPDAPQMAFWFGSRMYRGDDIYLFNTWPFDGHNFLGGGLNYHGSTVDTEFAVGSKKDSTWFLSDDAKKAGETLDSSSQRYIVVQKTLIPIEEGKKLKTNIEFHYLPKVAAQFKKDPTSLTATAITIPSDTGLMAGFQYNLIGTSRWFFNYGWGNVIGGIYAYDYPLASVTTDAGATITGPGLNTRKGGRSYQGGIVDGREFPDYAAGVLYAFVLQGRENGAGDRMQALSSSIRPMFYVSDHIHAGFELDVVNYFRRMSDGDVSYAQLSPMLEYALNKNVWGTPKFRLVASQAYYASQVQKYGEMRRNAFTLGLGFEIWF